MPSIQMFSAAQLQVQGAASVESFSGAFYSIQVSSPVRELHWRDGLDNVYAASEDAVSLQCLQVALNDIRFVCYMDGAKLHAFARH